MSDDRIQHGIDDDPNNDPKKGAELGGIGGAVTGAVAGSVAGPVGTVIGAVVGGVAGAVASGAAVGVVDRHDNDNTVTGIGHGATTDVNHPGPNAVPGAPVGTTTGNTVPGIQTGGHAVDGSGAPDTRGITEKVADTVTGDRTDDKTGRPV